MQGILKLSLVSGYAAFAACLVAAIFFATIPFQSPFGGILALIFVLLSLVGVCDLIQTKHAIDPPPARGPV